LKLIGWEKFFEIKLKLSCVKNEVVSKAKQPGMIQSGLFPVFILLLLRNNKLIQSFEGISELASR